MRLTVGWVPVWMIGLWAAFAITLNVSLHWLCQCRWVAAQKLGAVMLTLSRYIVLGQH